MTQARDLPLESGIVEIRTTFGSCQDASACAERLVAGRLAACVQAEEWRCTCKTTFGRREACVAAIVGAHPFQTPQVTVAPVDANAAYAAWVRESVEAP